jgi:hypothetical protein
MSLSLGANKLSHFIPPHSEKKSDGALRDVSELIAWAKKTLSQSRAETDMATLALRLNDLGLSRLELTGQAALKEAKRTIEGARDWLRGAFQEIAIGWFSGNYGLPLPAALARAFAKDEAAPIAVKPHYAIAAQIPAEMQWVKTAEIFANATSGADAAGRLHAEAGAQIDAASYAFDLLLEEIGPLMIYTKEDEELEVRRFERPAPRIPLSKQARQKSPEHAAA